MRRGAWRPKLKNSFILLALFVALNVDVGAVWLYSKYPHVFQKSAAGNKAVENVESIVEAEPDIREAGIEPIKEPSNIIDVDIIVDEPGSADASNDETEDEPTIVEEPGGDVTEGAEDATDVPGDEEETMLPKRVPADYMLADLSNFRQDERGWAYDPLGHTNQTLREFGCTVTSVANAITNYDQDFITPRILNQNLIKARGFTDRGWLKWSAISAATDGKYSARVFGSPSHANIDSCMANNEYPVVKIFLRGEVQHWVLIVGKRNGEYLIRDPLEGDRDEKPILLSSRAKGVHSLRCIKKN